MDLIAIPLIIIMTLAFIFYTISVFSTIKTRAIDKVSLSLIHFAILLLIVGLFYMSGVASKLSYTYASYSLMNMHSIVGTIASILLVIHAIILTILRRKNKRKSNYLNKGFNIFSFLLWLVTTFCYIITIYIGVLASIK